MTLQEYKLGIQEASKISKTLGKSKAQKAESKEIG